MSHRPLSRGTLIWSGEHWINYLRPPDSDADTGMVSLYHAYYSPAGQGTTACVSINGDPGFAAVCTDNPEFAEFILDTMIRGGGGPFDTDLSVVDAQFSRGGDIRSNPSWHIVAGDQRIRATWSKKQPQLVGPPTIHPRIVFTVLCFTDEVSIELNGQSVAGQPYPREAWSQNLGKPHSSCVFALAETMIAAE